MDEDSGEVRPADGALPSAPAALPPPPHTDAAPTIEPPAADSAVGDPPPPAGEGDRREAVEGAAPPPASTDPTAAPAIDPPATDPPATDPAVGNPSRPAVEGDRHKAVEGDATPAVPEVEPTNASAPVPIPVPLPAPSRPPLRVPPLLEFAAWRLLELVATVLAASLLVGLVLPADAPADAAILAERLAVTVPLLILALLIAAVVGLPIGYAAARVGSWPDVALRAVTTLGASLNPVWLAMLLVLLFAVALQWLQPGGFIPWSNPAGAVVSLLLPALALGLPLAAGIADRLRDAFAAALAGPAMRTADMLGYSPAEAVRDFALRAALARTAARLVVPLALLAPMILVVEAVFYLPGLGRLIFTALAERDFGTLQLGLVALVVLVALCRFLGRLLEAVLDPRIARGA